MEKLQCGFSRGRSGSPGNLLIAAFQGRREVLAVRCALEAEHLMSSGLVCSHTESAVAHLQITAFIFCSGYCQ